MKTDPKTAEEGGRLAVSIPGWRWMPGMIRCWEDGTRALIVPSEDGHFLVGLDDAHGGPVDGLRLADAVGGYPDLDDPATAGCLLALLGPSISMTNRPDGTWWVGERRLAKRWWGDGVTLGRACIAAAAANGRWPGGGE